MLRVSVAAVDICDMTDFGDSWIEAVCSPSSVETRFRDSNNLIDTHGGVIGDRCVADLCSI